MKKVISTLLAGAMALCLTIPAFAADDVKRVYVSPGGQDSFLGETANNAVKSPDRARDLARELKADGSEVQVIFMEGTYELDGTFLLEEEDSGTAENPVIYRAAEGAEVKFTTAKKLTASDFKESPEYSNASVLYEADLAELGITETRWPKRSPHILLADGEKVPMAEAVYGTGEDAEKLDTAATLSNLEDGQFVVAGGKLYYAPEDYVVEGEIYLTNDYETQEGSGDLTNVRATVKMNGVSNVKFENIDVFCGVSSAYVLNECDNVTIYGANISHMNGWGIVANLSKNISVISCDIGNMTGVENTQFHSTGGITMNASLSLDFTKLEGVAGGENVRVVDENNLIKNCTVHDTVGVAINVGGMGTTVENNLISNIKNIGISFVGNDHVIQNNRVIDTVLGHSDNGAIYSGRSWTSRGTVIKNNFIYYTTGLTDSYEKFEDTSPAGLYGIYLDDCLSGIEVDGNVIYNMQGGIMAGGGRDNVITNNIINGQLGMHYDARGAGSPYDNSKHLAQPAGVIYTDMKALLTDSNYDETDWAKYSGWTETVSDLASYEAGTTDVRTLGTPENVTIDGNLFFGEYLAFDWDVGDYDNYVRIDSLVNYTGTNPASYTEAVSFANGEVITTGLSAEYPATTENMGLLADDGYDEAVLENEYLTNEGNGFTAIAAIYNTNGVLKSISTAEDAYVFDGQVVGMDVVMPAEAVAGEVWFLKVMLWDSLNGMVPLTSQNITIGQ